MIRYVKYKILFLTSIFFEHFFYKNLMKICIIDVEKGIGGKKNDRKRQIYKKNR